MNRYVAGHLARTKRRPLSDRQGLLLAYARARACNKQTFPSDAEIMSAFPANFRTITNVRECLLSLHARGLLAAIETGWSPRERIVTRWEVTEAGWNERV